MRTEIHQCWILPFVQMCLCVVKVYLKRRTGTRVIYQDTTHYHFSLLLRVLQNNEVMLVTESFISLRWIEFLIFSLLHSFKPLCTSLNTSLLTSFFSIEFERCSGRAVERHLVESKLGLPKLLYRSLWNCKRPQQPKKYSAMLVLTSDFPVTLVRLWAMAI